MKFTPGLLQPNVVPKHPTLIGSTVPGYRPPAWIDSRSKVLPPSNQGTSSECVLYALCGLAEARRWKLHGDFTQMDPAPAYRRAKQLDGMPTQPGTTLEAGLQAMLDLNLLSAVAQESIRTIWTLPELKRALHRYDVVLTAWQATDAFLTPDSSGWIKSGGNFLGGHATLCCYYDEAEQSIGWQDNYGAARGFRGFCRIKEADFPTLFNYGLVFDYLTP